ncbi:MAG: hypothetical protein JWQ87_2010 [Candidatus Sulfotelmatobacter sp.]|nr:hypothetical protein [Candidatus Sulfotelmatobacter sp.]
MSKNALAEVSSTLGGLPGTGALEAPPKAEKELTFKESDLERIIASAVAAAVRSSSGLLADAIKESRKPYVDPKQQENDETMKKQMREQSERIAADIRASQDLCPHLQGSNPLSEQPKQTTSIVMHRRDTNDVIGICTNCLRVFRPSDPDYGIWMRKKSGNKISEAGRRFFLDPAAAQRAAAA